MIHIVGHNKIKQMQVFEDVRDVISDGFDCDVYLGAFAAGLVGGNMADKVIYNMEYLHDDAPLVKRGGYLGILQESYVIDFSMSNVEYLKSNGIDAFYMPYGYGPSLERAAHGGDKPIDVMFIGSMHHQRRADAIAELSKHFNVEVLTDCYGADLDNSIGRAKVHLNIHHAEGQPLETVRLNYLLANGCSVVSEPGSDNSLNAEYKDALVFSGYSELVDACHFAIGQQKTWHKPMHDSKSANDWAKGKLCLQ